MNCNRIVGPFIIALALAACGGDRPLDSSLVAASGPASGPAGAASGPAGAASGPAGGASAPTVAVTPRGTAIGPIAERVVPAAGGSLTSADGRLTIDVPAGALPAMTKISIQAISNESPGGSGVGYRLLPEGPAFAAPVKITFTYGDADINGSEPLALNIAYQDAAGRWNAIQQLAHDEVARTVSVQTTHFSDWSLLLGWQLTPASASIGAGKAVDFEVTICYPAAAGSGELARFVPVCRRDPRFFNVEEWSVNGVDGGKVATGTVASSSPGTARYSAPNSAPPTNPVNVAARGTMANGKTLLLIASVWVEAYPPLSGNIISTQVTKVGTATMTHTTTASVTFKYEVAEGLYRVTAGHVHSRLDSVDPGVCEWHVAFAGVIGLQDAAIMINDEGRYTAEGVTTAPHSGTTSCTSDGRVEALTMQQAGARWFPAPPAPNPFRNIPGAKELILKPNGWLNESLTWTPGNGGTETTVQWDLRPVR